MSFTLVSIWTNRFKTKVVKSLFTKNRLLQKLLARAKIIFIFILLSNNININKSIDMHLSMFKTKILKKNLIISVKCYYRE